MELLPIILIRDNQKASPWRDLKVKIDNKKCFILAVIVVMTLACAQQRPVLYPNAYLKYVGKETAESDINECIQLAVDYGAKEDSGARVAKDTAKGAAVGGAAGTAVGAVTGNLGSGAAAGVAGTGPFLTGGGDALSHSSP